ncbi:hypothetical protein T02_7198 [Trichinella nativa]|uniref:Uncharacterized protein n=1 Tax=Trichinella nativa TaxID=6335 RepID=A0A0V1L8H2_9BILA|nr:hypothetical protein T02_7198 [Trichinella nativa]
MPLLRALPKCKFLKCNRQFLQTLLSDICEKHFAAVSLQILKRFYGMLSLLLSLRRCDGC